MSSNAHDSHLALPPHAFQFPLQHHLSPNPLGYCTSTEAVSSSSWHVSELHGQTQIETHPPSPKRHHLPETTSWSVVHPFWDPTSTHLHAQRTRTRWDLNYCTSRHNLREDLYCVLACNHSSSTGPATTCSAKPAANLDSESMQSLTAVLHPIVAQSCGH